MLATTTSNLEGVRRKNSDGWQRKKRRGRKKEKKKKKEKVLLISISFSTNFIVNYSKIIDKHPKNSLAK